MSVLHLDEWGEGPAVLLLHGMPTTTDHLAPLGRALAAERRVLLAHMPGYGKSAPLAGNYTMDRARDALERTLLERGFSEVDVVGYSGGAYRALELAFSGRVRVRRLCLLAGLAGLDPEVKEAFSQLAKDYESGVDLLDVTCSRFVSPAFAEEPAVREEVARCLKAAPPDVLAAEMRALAVAEDFRPRLASLAVPALVRVGALDLSTIPAWSEEMAARLPKARLEIVPERGHALLLEDLEGTVESVRRFLAD